MNEPKKNSKKTISDFKKELIILFLGGFVGFIASEAYEITSLRNKKPMIDVERIQGKENPYQWKVTVTHMNFEKDKIYPISCIISGGTIHKQAFHSDLAPPPKCHISHNPQNMDRNRMEFLTKEFNMPFSFRKKDRYSIILQTNNNILPDCRVIDKTLKKFFSDSEAKLTDEMKEECIHLTSGSKEL